MKPVGSRAFPQLPVDSRGFPRVPVESVFLPRDLVGSLWLDMDYDGDSREKSCKTVGAVHVVSYWSPFFPGCP